MRRYDVATLGQVERLPSGGIRVPATLTRAGVFQYVEPDGSVRREYRPPAEVFADASLATLRGAPVTLGHPSEDVRPETWRDLAVGHGGDDVRQDGEHVAAHVYLHDADAISAVERRDITEISLGYDQVWVPGPGVTDSGERYDGTQTKICYNHIALVKRGRAGRSVGLRLDTAGDQERPIVKIEVIDGKEYEIGTPEHAAALDARKRRDAAQEAELSRFRAERKARVVAAAKARGVTVRKDADESSIMADTIAKLAPEFSLEGASPEYIAGAFAMALAMALPAAAPSAPPSSEESMDADMPEDEERAAEPAQGAEQVRRDVYQGRKRKDAPDAPAVPADVAARQAMIKRGASFGPAHDVERKTR